MSRVKYIVVEVDGVEMMQPIERLLDDRDVVVTSPGYPEFLDDALTQITAQFQAIEVGATDIDSILIGSDWDVLVDQNGYVLQRGY
jgi:hypothetical protein